MEANLFTQFGNGGIRLEQKSLEDVEPFALQFLDDASANCFREPALQLAPRNSGFGSHVRHVEVHPKIAPDEIYGYRYDGVVNGQNPRALKLDHLTRSKCRCLLRHAFAIHHSVQY